MVSCASMLKVVDRFSKRGTSVPSLALAWLIASHAAQRPAGGRRTGGWSRAMVAVVMKTEFQEINSNNNTTTTTTTHKGNAARPALHISTCAAMEAGPATTLHEPLTKLLQRNA